MSDQEEIPRGYWYEIVDASDRDYGSDWRYIMYKDGVEIEQSRSYSKIRWCGDAARDRKAELVEEDQKRRREQKYDFANMNWVSIKDQLPEDGRTLWIKGVFKGQEWGPSLAVHHSEPPYWRSREQYKDHELFYQGVTHWIYKEKR